MQKISEADTNRHLKELIEYAFRLHVSVPGGTLAKWRELIETGEDVRKIRLYIYWYSRKINGKQNPEAVNALFGKIDHCPVESDEIPVSPREYPDLSGVYSRSIS
jgi:hypothetical protein